MTKKNEFTIKEISDELEIDKQKISRYIRENKIKYSKKKSQTYIYDERTKNLIIEHFQNIKKKEPIQKPIQKPVNKSDNKQIDINKLKIENIKLIEQNINLNKIIKMLKNEKIELQKDKENNQIIIERLTILLKNEQTKNSLTNSENKINTEKYQTENTNEKSSLEKNSTKKNSFWKRLFQ